MKADKDVGDTPLIQKPSENSQAPYRDPEHRVAQQLQTAETKVTAAYFQFEEIAERSVWIEAMKILISTPPHGIRVCPKHQFVKSFTREFN